MKILGLTCGRKLSNTEILMKEALMGAQELGAEVELVRLMDLNIKPCTGCNACVIDLMEKGGSGACVIKDDDFGFIDEKIHECDGLIVGSPIYEKTPQGLLKVLNDRMGPSHDMAIRMIAKKIREEKGITTGKGPDERSFKTRIAATFGVGGSDWTHLTLPLMFLFTMPMNMKLVDQVIFDWTALPGVVTLNEEYLKRARKMGRHVAESLMKPLEEVEYIGDPGMCPVCHNRVIHVNDDASSAVCAVCGVPGTIAVEDGKVKFVTTEEQRKLSIADLPGKFKHADDMAQRSLKPPANMHEVRDRVQKYKDYLTYSKPAR